MTETTSHGYFLPNTVSEMQLIFAVMLFGIGNTAMRHAMLLATTGPMTFTACRMVLSTLFLVMLHSFFGEKEDATTSALENRKRNSDTLFWGSLCGLAIALASATQQIAFISVTAGSMVSLFFCSTIISSLLLGKTGFMVGMFVVFVPFTEWILACNRDALTTKTWAASVVALIGLYLLSGCGTQENCFEGKAKVIRRVALIMSLVMLLFASILTFIHFLSTAW